jgi:hypothetical protein
MDCLPGVSAVPVDSRKNGDTYKPRAGHKPAIPVFELHATKSQLLLRTHTHTHTQSWPPQPKMLPKMDLKVKQVLCMDFLSSWLLGLVVDIYLRVTHSKSTWQDNGLLYSLQPELWYSIIRVVLPYRQASSHTQQLCHFRGIVLVLRYCTIPPTQGLSSRLEVSLAW